MATITSVGIFATGFRTFRHVRHVAALDLASWAGQGLDRAGHGGAWDRVRSGSGSTWTSGSKRGLGAGGLAAAGGGGQAPPPPQIERVPYGPVLHIHPPTIQPTETNRVPSVASRAESQDRVPYHRPHRSPIFLLYFQSSRPCHKTRHLPLSLPLSRPDFSRPA